MFFSPFGAGKLLYADLDERALDALKEFPADGALAVLKQFLESSLEHVSNKSAYLCGVMKTYRQKSKLPSATSQTAKGPDEEKIKVYIYKKKCLNYTSINIQNLIYYSRLF